MCWQYFFLYSSSLSFRTFQIGTAVVIATSIFLEFTPAICSFSIYTTHRIYFALLILKLNYDRTYLYPSLSSTAILPFTCTHTFILKPIPPKVNYSSTYPSNSSPLVTTRHPTRHLSFYYHISSKSKIINDKLW